MNRCKASDQEMYKLLSAFTLCPLCLTIMNDGASITMMNDDDTSITIMNDDYTSITIMNDDT